MDICCTQVVLVVVARDLSSKVINITWVPAHGTRTDFGALVETTPPTNIFAPFSTKMGGYDASR